MKHEKDYIYYVEHCPVSDKTILLESQHGSTLGGNIAAIAKELAFNPDYKRYSVWLSCQTELMAEQERFLKLHGMEKIKLAEVKSDMYYRLLATAKYLVNDNTFLLDFIKRPEQVYLNTWHGTPLKTLGRKIRQDFAMIGNAQKNFLCADYLLCPNEFTLCCLTEDYMLENIGNTKLLLTGYPRNTVFLDKQKREELRKECGFDDMQVYVYMPTWRGVLDKVVNDQQNASLMEYFKELDGLLSDSQRVYVKLHPMNNKGINLAGLNHIFPFPRQYDTYEFLNAADGLITDYSSIFFDYAITGQKIVLFTYDKEEYTADRGFYFPMEELPFPQVNTVKELAEKLNEPKSYDDAEFLKKFCAYDNAQVTSALCAKVILGKDSPLVVERMLTDNGKKNVLVYAGGLTSCRTTERFLDLIKDLDTSLFNYTLLYKMDDVRYHQYRLSALPEGMNFMGFYEACSLPEKQKTAYLEWRDGKGEPSKKMKKIIRNLAQHERDRLLTSCRVDYVLDFSGSDDETVLMLQAFPMLRIQMENMSSPVYPQVRGMVDKTTVKVENTSQLSEVLTGRLEK